MAQTMDPKQVLLQQHQAEIRAAIRSGKTGLRLLDDSDQNIGNATVLEPQAGPATIIPPPLANNARLINLTAKSANGQSMTVTMTASRISNQSGFPGPVTGIIEFGNGSQNTRVEFDIPVGPFVGSITQASNAVEPQDGGVMVSLPTGVIRAYARYDNQLLANLLGTTGSLAQYLQANGQPTATNLGPGAPLSGLQPENLRIKAMATYYNHRASRVYKTLYCYQTPDPPAAVPITVVGPSTIGGFSTFAFFCLPAFTKRVQPVFFPGTSTVDIILHDGIRPTLFASGVTGNILPTFDVKGHNSIIGIKSTGGQITLLQFFCELGL